MEQKIVLPGDKIGTIEQFFPGEGTKEESGTIIAIRPGYLIVDEKAMKVSVKGPWPLPRPGDIVIGQVALVLSAVAVVDITVVNGKKLLYKLQGAVERRSLPYRVREMSEIVEEEDIIRAEVIRHDAGQFLLSVSKPYLGVLYSSCPYCGGKLVYSDMKHARCLVCKRLVPKKMVSPTAKKRKKIK